MNDKGFTLQVVLATFPQSREKEFNIKIIDEYNKSYIKGVKKYSRDYTDAYLYCKEDTAKKVRILYNPIRFYILGNYDVAYISIIDNLKFAQKLFEPEYFFGASNTNGIFPPHAFQSFTGITNTDSDNISNTFYHLLNPNSNLNKYYYLGICNLKLNNGFLIGNGNEFHDKVVEIINEKFDTHNSKVGAEKKLNAIILRSFSWFDISIVIFSNQLTEIANMITDLRKLEIQNLGEVYEELITNSLYKTFFNKSLHKNFYKTSVFSDTHSYFGINANLIEEKPTNSFIKSYLMDASKETIRTEIEWQIKPGHMRYIEKILNELNNTYNLNFEIRDKYFLPGKTDYFIQESKTSILTIYYIIRHLIHDNSELFKHARKLKTRLLFKREPFNGVKKRRILMIQNKLRIFAYDSKLIKKINLKLKSLKISREIRWKVIKIFSNYNNGIQDPILFPFFLDFTIFTLELIRFINKEFRDWELLQPNTNFDNSALRFRDNSVDLLEVKLIHKIVAFQESFDIRMLNGYQFEDIIDFDLDFNSSVQQLLSAYNSLVIDLGNIFYNGKKYSFGPIVQLNLKDTISNYHSFNYYIHHLISPEFVFATLKKEIFNCGELDDIKAKNIIDYYFLHKDDLKIFDESLYEMQQDGIIDIKYFLNDCVQYFITYDIDFELFNYWFWTYNLQNTLLYDLSGSMNENHFKKEMLRMFLIIEYFNISNLAIECPLPELQTLWDRHYTLIKVNAKRFIEFLSQQDLTNRITKYIGLNFSQYYEGLNQSGKFLGPLSSEITKKLLLISKLDNDIVQDAFINVRSKFEALENGSIPKQSVSNILYINWKMSQHLNNIYKINKKVTMLKRDWKTGSPLVTFIKWRLVGGQYSVDQTGGIFFENVEDMHLYWKNTSEILNCLLHYSFVTKKDFIQYFISNKKIIYASLDEA